MMDNENLCKFYIGESGNPWNDEIFIQDLKLKEICEEINVAKVKYQKMEQKLSDIKTKRDLELGKINEQIKINNSTQSSGKLQMNFLINLI